MIVMIHSTAGIQDNVVSDDGAGVNDHTCGDHHPFAQVHIGGKHRTGVHGVDTALPPGLE